MCAEKDGGVQPGVRLSRKKRPGSTLAVRTYCGRENPNGLDGDLEREQGLWKRLIYCARCRMGRRQPSEAEKELVGQWLTARK